VAASGLPRLNRGMDLKSTMQALAKAGTAAMRKTYVRHGAREPMFGVPYAALYALQKRLGVDQALAEALWATGNHDARILATLVADGQAVRAATLQSWLQAADHRFLAMAFAGVAARSVDGLACALEWIDADAEFVAAAGWATLAGLAAREDLADATFAKLLPRLAARIHDLPNYTRLAANSCLIAIGLRPGLTEQAMAVAVKVGAVDVDHGDTSCKTPLASEYIAKCLARRAGKGAAKKAAPAKKAAAKQTAAKATKGTPAKKAAAKR
jgi:3-methyladenine DNA glycosylase AlkD